MADSSIKHNEENKDTEVIEQKDKEIVKNQEEVKETEIEEKKVDEKKYTEVEAKKMANDLAKDYYNKGYHLGVKKIKEELQQGEKALAVNFKNALDNIFSISPEFSEKLNNNINKSILKISREILGYEIDKKLKNILKKLKFYKFS